MGYLADLGLRIKTYAKQKGFSQKALGDCCDVSQTQISRIFIGAGDTATEKLKSICIALEVSPEDLLFGEEENASFLYRPTNRRAKENKPPGPTPEKPHETIKMLSDLNYKLVSEGGRLEVDELAAIEALLKTCLKSLHKELKNDTESVRTA